MTVNFVCVWMGQKYGPEYPAILKDMVDRNSSRLEPDRAWWILTDRPDEAPNGMTVIAPDPRYDGWWTKCQVFSPELPWAAGDRCVYFDLDVAITGRLEDLIETPGILKDFLWPGYNSSVMVWTHPEHSDVWEALTPEITRRAPGPIVPAELLASGMINGGDQEHITDIAKRGGNPWSILRPDWCVNYRLSAEVWPPTGAKVVVFNGQPKPHEVTSGWVPDVWKVGGFTSLPVMDGANVGFGNILENVRINAAKPLPWFDGHPMDQRGKKAVALVCGAPSMRQSLPEIRAQKRRGVKIVTVNNAWRFLVENGIKPDAHIMLDARADNAEFVKDAPAGVRYFIASQCHPDVFEALKDRDVIVWHNGVGSNDEMKDALGPWWDEGPNQRPCVLIPGGGTVGLRALWLLTFSGYRTIHVYGIDSSMSGGAHHAYAQPLNDGEHLIEVVLRDQKYVCALWMARQAHEFRETWQELRGEGVAVHVHGSGLIPDLAKALREEARG